MAKPSADKALSNACPCGKGEYTTCCGRWHAGEPAPDPQSLMRSRYSAYVLKLEDYLLQTWHPDTRPVSLELSEDKTQWLGLVVQHFSQSGDSGEVEFTARYKINGRAHRLHERSAFKKANGQWFYVSGEISG